MLSVETTSSYGRNAVAGFKLPLIGALALALFMALTLPAFPQTVPIDRYEKVTRVLDGDTFEVEGGERIRLIGVQAPELGSGCYAQEAKAQLAAVISDGARLIRKGKDKYGRTLAYVYVNWTKPQPSQRLYRNSVNLYLIINGYAKSYRRFSHRYAVSYNKAETWAKQHREGLWGDACPQPIVSPHTSLQKH
jgi:micrococcal nuclease